MFFTPSTKTKQSRTAVKVPFNIITVDGKAALDKAMQELYTRWNEEQMARYANRRERAIAMIMGEVALPAQTTLERIETSLSNGVQSISLAAGAAHTKSVEYEAYSPKKCNCSTFSLMVSGCKCGGI